MNDFYIEDVAERYPQLRERAVVTLVNGLDTLEMRRINLDRKRGLAEKLIRLVSGQAGRDRALFDGDAVDAIRSVAQLLQDADKRALTSDRAIEIVADKLRETREVLRQLGREVQDLQGALVSLEQEYRAFAVELRAGLRLVEAGSAATDHLIRVGDRWNGALHHLPPIARLVQLLDELYWFQFGSYLRLEHRSEERQLKLSVLRDRLQRLLSGSLQRNAATAALHYDAACPLSTWLAPIQSMAETDRYVMAYLTSDAERDRRPLTATLAAVLHNEAELPTRMPRILDVDRLVDIGMREFEARVPMPKQSLGIAA